VLAKMEPSQNKSQILNSKEVKSQIHKLFSGILSIKVLNVYEEN